MGISDRPGRASKGVAEYLADYYQIIPVNPTLTQWNGQTCYPSLSEIPAHISVDLVDVFRSASDTPPVVTEAIARKVKFIWLQQGIVSDESANLAAAADVPIVMDACLAVEHAKRRS